MKIYFRLVYLLFFVFFACNDKETAVDKDTVTSDEHSTKETNQLYRSLHDYMDKGILLGHQDALAYGSTWYGEDERSDVKSACGDFPAVYGWNLGKIESGALFNVDSVFFTDIMKHIIDVNDRKGISVISWYADNPVTGNGYAVESDGSIVASLLPNGENHGKYLRYLDRFASFFPNLKNKDGEYIPVIVRLFHDYNNVPYWWGSNYCSPEEYKELWKITVDYLRNVKQIHHLLYLYSIYSPKTTDGITESYPGDKYVDLIGADLFLNLEEDPEGNIYRKNLDRSLSAVTGFSKEHKKIPAISCTGLDGIRISNYFTNLVYPAISKYNISYILFWRNAWNDEEHYYIPVPGHPASDNFYEFVNNNKILTLKKI
ncbi:MAG: glycoside hydrolase family 26 protein [Dysgonamonadaceae bacterium]|jgi:mannan endo-1,4-beta-mannosidase|nr:glycoside hydrolase family 26 protein [Dysgonamonadaceae bacterium]